MSFRKFLRWLFADKSCRHRWEEAQKFNINSYDWGNKRQIGAGSKLKCKRCGDMKFVHFKVKTFWDFD